MSVRRLPVSWDLPTASPAAQIAKRVSIGGKALLIERLEPCVTGRAFVQLIQGQSDDEVSERIQVREGDQLFGAFKYVNLYVTPPARDSSLPAVFFDALKPFAVFTAADDPAELPYRAARPNGAPLLFARKNGTGSDTGAVVFPASAVELFNLFFTADGAASVGAHRSGTTPTPTWSVPAGGGSIILTRSRPLHLGLMYATQAAPTLEVVTGGAVAWDLTVEYLPHQEA